MDKVDRVGLTAFFVGCLFFAFLGGAYIAIAEWFPYKYLDNAYRAAWALVQQEQTIDDPMAESTQWLPARNSTRGVDIYDSKRAYSGYTLYASNDQTTAYLIDMQGDVLHKWHINYSSLWHTTPDGRKAQPEKMVYFRKAVMYPNGDLLAIFAGAGDTPWGYGLVKLDANSNVLWKYHAAAHHDLYLTDDNRVFVLTQAYRDKKVAGAHLDSPWLDDYLVELNGDNGHVIKKTSLFESMWHSRYQPLLNTRSRFGEDPLPPNEDPLHTNSVQHLGDKLGQAFAPADGNGDQVLLSMRNPGLAVLFDVKSGDVTWARRGTWLGQHSMRALPNGRFTIFDNYGNFGNDNTSRILEIDSKTHSIAWQYEGDSTHPFSSVSRGDISTLANGNRLIAETNAGRLFEVTPDGDIVWEYINPIRGGDDDQYIPGIFLGQRIKPDWLALAFRHSLNTSQE